MAAEMLAYMTEILVAFVNMRGKKNALTGFAHKIYFAVTSVIRMLFVIC